MYIAHNCLQSKGVSGYCDEVRLLVWNVTQRITHYDDTFRLDVDIMMSQVASAPNWSKYIIHEDISTKQKALVLAQDIHNYIHSDTNFTLGSLPDQKLTMLLYNI